MMICKADFEELFPDVFRPREPEIPTAKPGAECLARWEDDGGRTRPAQARWPAITSSGALGLAPPIMLAVAMNVIAYAAMEDMFKRARNATGAAAR